MAVFRAAHKGPGAFPFTSHFHRKARAENVPFPRIPSRSAICHCAAHPSHSQRILGSHINQRLVGANRPCPQSSALQSRCADCPSITERFMERAGIAPRRRCRSRTSSPSSAPAAGASHLRPVGNPPPPLPRNPDSGNSSCRSLRRHPQQTPSAPPWYPPCCMNSRISSGSRKAATRAAPNDSGARKMDCLQIPRQTLRVRRIL